VIPIRFTDETRLEEGLRIIVLSGPVEFTGVKGVYKVPEDIIALLDERRVPYEVVKLVKKGNRLIEANHQ
jgi:hypothetical protein